MLGTWFALPIGASGLSRPHQQAGTLQTAPPSPLLLLA